MLCRGGVVRMSSCTSLASWPFLASLWPFLVCLWSFLMPCSCHVLSRGLCNRLLASGVGVWRTGALCSLGVCWRYFCVGERKFGGSKKPQETSPPRGDEPLPKARNGRKALPRPLRQEVGQGGSGGGFRGPQPIHLPPDVEFGLGLFAGVGEAFSEGKVQHLCKAVRLAGCKPWSLWPAAWSMRRVYHVAPGGRCVPAPGGERPVL